MTIAANRKAPLLTEDETEALLAQIEKGQQLAGHFPSAETLNRVRRVIAGEITSAQARAEIDAKYPLVSE